MYAVFEDGSRQYRVQEGDIVKVDFRAADVGSSLEFDRVLLFQNDADTTIGHPVIAGAAWSRKSSIILRPSSTSSTSAAARIIAASRDTANPTPRSGFKRSFFDAGRFHPRAPLRVAAKQRDEIMHETHMRAAIALARQSIRSGGGPFGAVVVREGIVVGEGTNRVTASNDPTAHAEILAIRAAGSKLNTFRLSDCEIYASCEPCPMCLAAIYWARIKGIHYAGTRADAAAAGFDDAVIYDEIAKTSGERRLAMRQMLAEEGRTALAEWLKAPKRVNY